MSRRLKAGLIWGGLFTVYFVWSLISIYGADAIIMNYFFGADGVRVLDDWTVYLSDHYRTQVHPLYVILILPLMKLLMLIGFSDVLAVVLFLDVIATLNVYLVYRLLKHLVPVTARPLVILGSVLYAFSWAQLSNTLYIDSFLVTAFTLLLFWNYIVAHWQKPVRSETLIALGILMFGLLITNLVHFLLGSALLLIRQKKDIQRWLWVLFAYVLVGMVVSCLQYALFPTAQDAFVYVIVLLVAWISGKAGYHAMTDIHFISWPRGQNWVNLLQHYLGTAFTGGAVNYDTAGGLALRATWWTWVWASLLLVGLIYTLYRLIKQKQYLLLGLTVAIGLELLLHLFYGNSELQLYTILVTGWLVILLFAGGLSDLVTRYPRGRVYLYVGVGLLSAIALGTALGSVVRSVWLTYARFGAASVPWRRDFLVLLAVIGAGVTGWGWAKLRHQQRQAIIAGSLALVWVVALIVVNCCLPRVSARAAHPVTSNYVLFGMGQREKYVYAQQADGDVFYHYDYHTQTRTLLFSGLHDSHYDAAQYRLTCRDADNQELVIYEDAVGLYYQQGAVVTPLDVTQAINIPDFAGYSQQRYLQMLFHEVMVNVIDHGFTPNYLTYGNSWYRDGALMAMVLQATDNLAQMRFDPERLTVYDRARSPQLTEVDNLGELLFMLSLLPERPQALIDQVLAEAARLNDQGLIMGTVDGEIMPIYATTWLKFGLEQLGLDSSAYHLGTKTDSYTDLCWWYPHEVKNQENAIKMRVAVQELFDTRLTKYPYLSIARLHYYQIKSKLPTDLSGPLSYERQNYRQPLGTEILCTPHGWAAAELFLYLLDYDNY